MLVSFSLEQFWIYTITIKWCVIDILKSSATPRMLCVLTRPLLHMDKLNGSSALFRVNIENTIIRKQCLGVKAFYPTGAQECCIQLSFNILYTNLCEVRYKC